jgi:phosphate transport system ATP-binding protein
METTVLNIKNLNAFYGESQALFDVNMEIYRKNVTAIMGPSGCGKSTLIRTVNRMHELTPHAYITGNLILDGEELTKLHTVLLRQKIGMVFQRPNPFPTMTIFENVIAGYKLNGIRKSKNELHQIAEESLNKSALWDEVKDKLFKKGTFLSGGQQQRLCIARALAMKPEILLLDEPTSALDPIASEKIEELILDLRKDVTMMLVTHNTAQAARVSDYTAFMYLGKLVEYGKTKKLFTNPDDKRTEEYLIGKFG